MKRRNSLIVLFVIIISVIILPFVANVVSPILKSPVQNDTLKVLSFIDKFIAKHPNCFDNEITREESGPFLEMELLSELVEDSLLLISEISMEFYGMTAQEKSSNYIVQFWPISRVDGIASREYDISFSVSAITSKEEAMKLKEQQRYYVRGQFVGYLTKPHLRRGGERYGTSGVYLGHILIANPLFVIKERL